MIHPVVLNSTEEDFLLKKKTACQQDPSWEFRKFTVLQTALKVAEIKNPAVPAQT